MSPIAAQEAVFLDRKKQVGTDCNKWNFAETQKGSKATLELPYLRTEVQNVKLENG